MSAVTLADVSRSRSPSKPRILIADDQADVLSALRLLLKNEGYDVNVANSPAGVLAAARDGSFDLALIDLNYARDTTSGQEGLQLLGGLRSLDAQLPVVVMTAWANIEIAVAAMRAGARDFVEKPWDNHRLLAVVRNQVEFARERRLGMRLEAENELLQQRDAVDLVAESPAMRGVLDMARRVASSSVSVLITGENGTGKSVLARFMHDHSPRAGEAFVAVNMGAMPESVFESEMFGHVRGAFTDAKADRVGRVEMADGGTLFLDEIGNIPLSQQAKLLRVIESREFERVGSSRTQQADVRYIAATNADLTDMVARQAFRQDLLFRLNTVEIRLPALRERRADIPLLAGRQLRDCVRRYQRDLGGFDASAMAALESYDWPGNVRELHNVIERAVLLAPGAQITSTDLRLNVAGAAAPSIDSMSLEDAERQLLQSALRRAGGNVVQAAEALGLSRSAMYRRIEKLGVKIDRA